MSIISTNISNNASRNSQNSQEIFVDNVAFSVNSLKNKQLFNDIDFIIPKDFDALSYEERSFHMIKYIESIIKHKKHSRIVEFTFKQILKHLDWQTGICNPSLETLSMVNSQKIYCNDHVGRGVRVLKNLKAIKIFNLGKRTSNVYEVNFEILKPFCKKISKYEPLSDTTFCVVQIKNKNIKDICNFKKEVLKGKNWQAPALLPIDFEFTEVEKDFIKHNFNRSDKEVDLAIKDWIKCNKNRIGFNWFARLIEFCKRRNWDYARKKFEAEGKKLPIYIPIEHSNSARIVSKIAYQAQINPKFAKYLEPKKREPTQEDINEMILENKLTDSFERSLGVSRIEALKMAKKQIWRDKYHAKKLNRKAPCKRFI